jgi:hypothetical protein
MSELTQDEFWLINVYFRDFHGFNGAHRVHDIIREMQKLSCGNGRQLVESLIKKQVLSLSPDGNQVKFTDYGLELYQALDTDQTAWEQSPIIKISNVDKDQILIRAGEAFKANRVLREILSQPRKELCVLDPYVGSSLFDLIEEVNPKIIGRVITSDKGPSSATATYQAFRGSYPSVEMRIVAYSSIHDRFILWDRAKGIHSGHSLKDLGKKDTQLNFISNSQEQFKLFEQRWSQAKVIP